MNILLTTAGRRTYMVEYFRNALQNKGKIYCANSTLTIALKEADGYVLTPEIYSEDYINVLLSFCKENNITAIVSLFDIDLPILAANREKFAKIGCRLVVSDSAVVEICNDKWKTYQFLKENHFSTPKTFLGINDALQAISKGQLNYPIVIKPRWGMASIGIEIAESEEDARYSFKKTLKKISNSYLKFESAEDFENCIIVQEAISFQEYGMDVVNDLNGDTQAVFVRKKEAMRAGETDVAEIVSETNIEAIGFRLGQRLKHIANLDVDLFYSNGDVIILELNCRFGGGYPFSHLAGADVPSAIVNWLEGNTAADSFLQVEAGVRGMKEVIPTRFM